MILAKMQKKDLDKKGEEVAVQFLKKSEPYIS
jgi:nitroreductase/Pyruvate/2-oxoacid:ferredoxin oxidoreductase delta subunit